MSEESKIHLCRDDDRTACGRWAGLVHAYSPEAGRVTCAACREAARLADQLRRAVNDYGDAVTFAAKADRQMNAAAAEVARIRTLLAEQGLGGGESGSEILEPESGSERVRLLSQPGPY